MSETQELQKVEIGKVFDADNDSWVKPSNQQVAMAKYFDGVIRQASNIQAVAIAIMKEQELHLALGYSRFDDYIRLSTPISDSQVYKYLAVGREMLDSFPQLREVHDKILNGDSVNELQPAGADDDEVNKLSSLGIEKLYNISKLDDASFKEIAKSDTLTLNDGTEISLEEIRAKSRRDFDQELRAYKDQLQESEKALDTVAQERDRLAKQNKELQEQARTAEMIKTTYGHVAQDVEVAQKKMEQVKKLVSDLGKEIYNLEFSDKVAAQLSTDIRHIHQALHGFQERVKQNNLAAFEIEMD